MAKRDNSKLRDLDFGTYEDDLPTQKSYKAKQVIKPKQDIPEFKRKLDESAWDEFTCKDWIEYFKIKAVENGVRFIRGDYIKENAIIKSLMGNFKSHEVKLMIEFVWDAPHTFTEKSTMGLWIFSKGWLNTVYNGALLWEKGEFGKKLQQPRVEKPNTVREWTKPVEETPSPVPQQEDKPKKKSKVTIGGK